MLTILLLFAIAPVKPAPFVVNYVLNVPVRIENMHITSAEVSCSLVHAEPTGIRTALTIAQRVSVPLVDGAFNGVVTVTVAVQDADAIRLPPNIYSCGLFYLWRNPDGSTFSGSTVSVADRAAAYTRLTGQEIAENTTQIEGSIPPQ